MRVLLVCAAGMADSEQLIAREASTHDAVIAVDGGADLCRAAGVRPTVVVGDLDSIGVGSRHGFEDQGIPFETHPSDKDATDLELAMSTARTMGAMTVTVTGAWSARLDHTLAALGVVVGAADLMPRIVEPGMEGWLLAPEGRPGLEFGGEGDVFSVIAIGGEAVVDVAGAKWPLSSATLEPLAGHGVSNVVVGDKATVTLHSGVALVTVLTR